MVIDLNRILMYANNKGCLQETPDRRIFCIVDGIVGGEDNGPLDPTPKPAGVVLAGTNPVAVDLVCARLMDFDYKKLPVLYKAIIDHPLPLCTFNYDEVMCKSNDSPFDRDLSKFEGKGFEFEPHFGWKGHLELTQRHVVKKIATTNIH